MAPKHRLPVRLTLLCAALAAVAVAAPSASAAPGEGALKLRLSARGAAVGSIAPATGKGTVKLPVKRAAIGSRSVVVMDGGIRLRRGKRAVKLTSLRLRIRGRGLVISAKLGKRRVDVFKARARAGRVTRGADRVRVRSTQLKLTRRASSRLRRALRLRRLVLGKAVRLSLSAAERQASGGGSVGSPAKPKPPATAGPGKPSTPGNPGICPVSAGTGGPPTTPPGSTADPAPLPDLSASPATTAASADWGFKQSFRSYVNAGGGSGSTPGVSARDGATGQDANTDGDLADAGDSIRFDGEGRYQRAQNPYDDQLVLEGEGTALFCHPTHRFRIALANPTVVIDGADARVVMDVTINQNGTDYPTKRVDFASLDLTGVRPDYGSDGKTATWTDVPAELTADGATAFGGFYAAGQALDPITIRAAIDSVPDPYASTCDTTGSGSPPATPQESAPPAAAPALSNPVAVSSGTYDWGYKSSFRSYVLIVPPAGTISGADGATYSANAFHFTATGGQYERGATPAADRAVLNARGIAVFCKTGHGFRVAMANPIVTLDGANSRLTLDVDQSYFGTEYPSRRVDYASLDLSGVTPVYSNGDKTITWSNVPAKVTAEGAKAFPQYAADTALDPITVVANIP